MEIPVWLQENNPAMCPCGCVGKRSRKNFVEKTLYDLAKLIRESVFSEKVARQPGLLQGLDPRAKLLGFACLLLTVSLVHNMLLLALTYFGLAVLAVLSRIPLGMFVKRVWIVVPLFTGIMLLPSLFNWVRPGTTALLLWQFKHTVNFGPFNFPAELAITVQGLKGSGLMILRVGVSVSLAALLTLTTRWTDLLKALRVLFVPRIFVTTLEMTFRYIYVLVGIVEEMFLARKARVLGTTGQKENRRFIAASLGTLFGKSQSMSEEVYAAMLARGYTGEIKTLNRLRLRFWDFVAVLVVFLVSLLLYAADKVMGGIL